MKKNPTKDNRLICTTFNNNLTSLLRNREKEYIEEQLELNKTNLPTSWKIIKDIVGKGKQYDYKPITFQIDCKETCDTQAIIMFAINILLKSSHNWQTKYIILLIL